jgi:hypothetical protein
MWFAPAKIIEERRSICSACKFSQREAKVLWCGKPLLGGEVTYKKKKHKLCGCNMFLKTAFKNVKCPLDKWTSVGNLTLDEKDEIRTFLKDIHTDYVSQEQLKQLYDYASKATGHYIEPTKCTPCIKDLLTKLRNDIE